MKIALAVAAGVSCCYYLERTKCTSLRNNFF
jgi:hypothetical protein